ncbi:MAG: hypothetical protein KJ666_07270 [Bacteroidetes bacterium]|nr:hypothetical protein [Bacteroidota bacterium]MBU2586358.1 hypothetical protein [Bacteroidota bacterium]
MISQSFGKNDKVVLKRRILYAFLISTILFGFGFSINFYYGRIGYLPINQAIIFDGGWRILSGQIPYIDFTTPNGLTPIYLQALIFKLFDVNWFSYLLHSSIINGLFCVLIFHFLKLLHLPSIYSFFYALISGVLLYPPSGTPYMDQHAFFFSLLFSFIVIKLCINEINKINFWLWFFIPVLFLFPYFSKQIPSLLLIPLIIIYINYKQKDHIQFIFKPIVLSLVFIVIVFILIFIYYKIDIYSVYLYSIKFPIELGVERVIYLFKRKRVIDFFNIWNEFHLNRYFIATFTVIIFILSISAVLFWVILKKKFYLIIIFAITVSGLISIFIWNVFTFLIAQIFISTFFYFYYSKKLNNAATAKFMLRSILPEVLFLEGLLVICLIFTAFTFNYPENGIPYIFFCLGGIHALHIKFKSENKNYANAKIFRSINLNLFITFILLSVAIFDAFNFNERINETRIIQRPSTLPSSFLTNRNSLPKNLSYLIWAVDGFYNYSESDFNNLANFLELQNENFFVYGDNSILYGIAKKISINPALWFHPGLTFPKFGTSEFIAFESQLIKNIKVNKVRFVVIEGERTWMKTRLTDFPQLFNLISSEKINEFRFGHIKVIELRN